jgi:hypothetical protein
MYRLPSKMIVSNGFKTFVCIDSMSVLRRCSPCTRHIGIVSNFRTYAPSLSVRRQIDLWGSRVCLVDTGAHIIRTAHLLCRHNTYTRHAIHLSIFVG